MLTEPIFRRLKEMSSDWNQSLNSKKMMEKEVGVKLSIIEKLFYSYIFNRNRKELFFFGKELVTRLLNNPVCKKDFNSHLNQNRVHDDKIL